MVAFFLLLRGGKNRPQKNAHKTYCDTVVHTLNSLVVWKIQNKGAEQKHFQNSQTVG